MLSADMTQLVLVLFSGLYDIEILDNCGTKLTSAES